jgi:hypothetical protein
LPRGTTFIPAAGTYFLALDRNGNGNGFTELKSLDTKADGWID